MSENVSNYDRLTSKQRNAIDVLLTGGNKHDAAAAAGVKVRTIDRWHKEPHFVAALRDGTKAAVSSAAERSARAMDTAVDTLVSLAKDESAAPSIRLRASVAIIEEGLKLHTLAESIKQDEEEEPASSITYVQYDPKSLPSEVLLAIATDGRLGPGDGPPPNYYGNDGEEE